MARLLILVGLACIILGLFWGPLSRLGLGRLPGDIVIRRDGFTVFLPVTSGLLVSVILSLVVTLLRAVLGR